MKGLTLSVAYSVDAMASLEEAAAFAMHGNTTYGENLVQEVLQSTSQVFEDADADNCPAPVQEFFVQRANSVFHTQISPNVKQKQRHVWDKNDNHSHVYNTKVESFFRESIAKEIWKIYGSVRNIHLYCAKGSAPGGMKFGDETTTEGVVPLLTKDQWHSIFGGLNSKRNFIGDDQFNTTYDFHYTMEKLYSAFKDILKPSIMKTEAEKEADSTELDEGCYRQLSSPIIYTCSVILEFFDIELVTAWIGNIESRFGRFERMQETNIRFKIFLEQMMRTAHRDPISWIASSGQRMHWTQIVHHLGTLVEGFETTARFVFDSSLAVERRKSLSRDGSNGPITFAPVGKFIRDGDDSLFDNGRGAKFDGDDVDPHLGPAVLREAYMLLKAQALYHLVFVCLTLGPENLKMPDKIKNPPSSIEPDKIIEWHKSLQAAHHARCQKNLEQDKTQIEKWDSRFTFLKAGQKVDRDEFIKCHPEVTVSGDGRGKWKLGNLCCKSKLCHSFEELLEDIEEELLQEIKKGCKGGKEGAKRIIQEALQSTPHYKMLNWFEEAVLTVSLTSFGLFM